MATAPALMRPSVPPLISGAVKWDWYVARPRFIDSIFQGFENIGLLTSAQNRQINLSLDAPESASFTIFVRDDIASEVWGNTLVNCLVCYRDGDLEWSGPLWTCRPTVNATTQTLDVTAVGWFQYLLKRLLKCGQFGVNPQVGPTDTTSGNLQSYVNLDPTAIAVDLIQRTQYEYPLPFTIGSVETNPYGVRWNVTYQQLQNIGQAIQTLSNVEGGFDFRVDPASLQINFYYSLVKGGTTVYGRGQDRPNAIFSMPGNISQLVPTEDASNTATQMTVLDQLSNLSQFPAPGAQTQAILTYGLLEDTASLSDVTSPTITSAYAEAEVLFREQPEIIWSFVPQAYNGNGNVPQPIADYDIGDFIYFMVNYGCLQVPDPSESGPRPIRLFAYTININNEGVETISNLQSVFTTTS